MNFNSLEISTHQELGNGEVLAVDLRRLYQVLDVKHKFNDWARNRLREAQADQGVDYLLLRKKSQVPHQGGLRKQAVTEFIVTADLAKEIAMLERTRKGKQVRRYFIEAEKSHRKTAELSSAATWMVLKLLKTMPAEKLLQLLAVRNPYGSIANNGKPRTGWRCPSYVAAKHREGDAMEFQNGVTQLNITVQLELPKFAEAIAAMERK